jgi:hypothetical protein
LVVDHEGKLPNAAVSFLVLDDNLIPEATRTQSDAPIFIVPVVIPICTKIRMKVSEQLDSTLSGERLKIAKIFDNSVGMNFRL